MLTWRCLQCCSASVATSATNFCVAIATILILRGPHAQPRRKAQDDTQTEVSNRNDSLVHIYHNETKRVSSDTEITSDEMGAHRQMHEEGREEEEEEGEEEEDGEGGGGEEEEEEEGEGGG
jgi:hypothetical protein